ncbi:hypothetical protein U1Q18_021963 [Sarracenia purpurea var. burkii]
MFMEPQLLPPAALAKGAIQVQGVAIPDDGLPFLERRGGLTIVAFHGRDLADGGGGILGGPCVGLPVVKTGFLNIHPTIVVVDPRIRTMRSRSALEALE